MDNNTEKFDVCIIGASLAGNYLCYLISNLGLKIAVIEEHYDIGLPLQCAGIVSRKIKKLIEIPNSIILNKLKVAKLVSPSGKSILLSGDEEPLVIDRIGLDSYFYKQVERFSNVSYYLGERFKSFSYLKEQHQTKLRITTSKRKFTASMLIGCDGPLSSVAKSLKSKNKVIYASQIVIRGSFEEDQAVMYFNPDWKELFGWIVPEGNKRYRIGLASSENVFSKYKKFLGIIHIDFKSKISQQGGIIPYGLMKNVAFSNILLLGDAACQVKATTGGGIIMLLTAVKIAAIAIRKSFKANNFSKKYLKKNYEKPCKSLIGSQLKIHYLIRMLLERFSSKDYDTFFKILKTHHIEQKISFYGDMDFPNQLILQLLKSSLVIKFLLKFFLQNPILLPKILFIFLKR